MRPGIRAFAGASAVAVLVGAAGCGSIAASPGRDAGPDAPGVVDSGVAAPDAALPDATVPDATVPDASLDASDGAPPPGADADADAGPPAPECDGSCIVTFASGTDWESFAGDLRGIDGADLGMAKYVCVSSAQPNCPTGALVYGDGAGVWSADLSAIPDAHWIWRGDTTTPNIVSDLAIAVFQKSFVLGTNPVGILYIAADDYAEVIVNGATAGSIGSVTDAAAAIAAQKTQSLDLTALLRDGENTITVVAQNGPGSFGGCSPCTYATNPAGVVFGGTLRSR